jgi:hypothetical protein
VDKVSESPEAVWTVRLTANRWQKVPIAVSMLIGKPMYFTKYRKPEDGWVFPARARQGGDNCLAPPAVDDGHLVAGSGGDHNTSRARPPGHLHGRPGAVGYAHSSGR